MNIKLALTTALIAAMTIAPAIAGACGFFVVNKTTSEYWASAGDDRQAEVLDSEFSDAFSAYAHRAS